MSDVINTIAVAQLAAYEACGWVDTGRRYEDARGARATVRWPRERGLCVFPAREGEGSSEGNEV